MSSEDEPPLNILQLDMKDLSVLEVADLWNTDINIYTLVDRPDKDSFLTQLEDLDMKVLSQEDEDEIWVVEFCKKTTPTPDDSDDKEEQIYTLYVYYNMDPFGDWLPEPDEGFGPFNIFIHTEHVLDFELLEELLEDSNTDLYKLEVYAPRTIATEYWKDSADYYEPIDEEGKDKMYYLGHYSYYFYNPENQKN